MSDMFGSIPMYGDTEARAERALKWWDDYWKQVADRKLREAVARANEIGCGVLVRQRGHGTLVGLEAWACAPIPHGIAHVVTTSV